MEAAELGWLASALFNVGVDLHASQRYAAAASAMQAAVAAAAVGLRGSPAESETGRIQVRLAALSGLLLYVRLLASLGPSAPLG